MVKLRHSWLPIGVSERRCSATTDLCPQCKEIETVPHLYRCEARAAWRHRFLIHLHEHLKETKTAADIRCIITKGIENWFLTGDTNDPDSIETVERIGWYKCSKDTFQKSGPQGKSTSIGDSAKARRTTQASNGRKDLLSSFGHTATPSGKRGAQLHTHPAKPAQTTSAPDPAKRHNNGWKWHMHTLHSC